MVVLGILLILLGAGAVLAALFASDGSVTVLGFSLTAFEAFLAGVIAAVCVLLGLWVMTYGAKRRYRLRQERKELARRAAKSQPSVEPPTDL